MSYPRCQDSARKKEETKHGNINALSILRGGHEPSGLGGQWSLLWSLRGKNRRKSTPGVGGAGLAQTAIGVGSGLEAKDKSCVVRWGYWRRWREPAVRVFVLVVLGPCLSCRFYRRWRLPFGGRWPGWREKRGGVEWMLNFSPRLLDTLPRGFWIRGSSDHQSGNPEDRTQWVSSPLREGNFFGW